MNIYELAREDQREILGKAHRKANRKEVEPKSELIVEIGKIFKSKREYRNLTIRQLEAKSGVDHAYITKIEAGKTNPSLEMLERLAEAMCFKLSLDLTRMKNEI
jgi:ribosome-binding protein aMBF1 (putative translation factor)